jgi:hypothetical protein
VRVERTSEPHIRNAAAIARQIIKIFQSVEVVHDDGGHGFWFGEAQVDGDAAAAFFAGFERAPIGDAAAFGAEMKAD